MSSPRQRVRALKQFDDAHAEGMRALETRDLPTFNAAVQAEAAILQEQSAILKKTADDVAGLVGGARGTKRTPRRSPRKTRCSGLPIHTDPWAASPAWPA